MNSGFEELKRQIERLNNGKGDIFLEATILKPIEQDLEVLEIIKEKSLTNCNLALVKDNRNYQNYCKEFEYFLNKYNESPNGFEINKEDLFTKKEFDLLWEWLENAI